jgi:hypothetical protein
MRLLTDFKQDFQAIFQPAVMAQSTYMEQSTKFWRISCPAKGTRVTSTVGSPCLPSLPLGDVCACPSPCASSPIFELSTPQEQTPHCKFTLTLAACAMETFSPELLTCHVAIAYFAVRQDRCCRNQHGERLSRSRAGNGVHRQAGACVRAWPNAATDEAHSPRDTALHDELWCGQNET